MLGEGSFGSSNQPGPQCRGNVRRCWFAKGPPGARQPRRSSATVTATLRPACPRPWGPSKRPFWRSSWTVNEPSPGMPMVAGLSTLPSVRASFGRSTWHTCGQRARSFFLRGGSFESSSTPEQIGSASLSASPKFCGPMKRTPARARSLPQMPQHRSPAARSPHLTAILVFFLQQPLFSGFFQFRHRLRRGRKCTVSWRVFGWSPLAPEGGVASPFVRPPRTIVLSNPGVFFPATELPLTCHPSNRTELRSAPRRRRPTNTRSSAPAASTAFWKAQT